MSVAPQIEKVEYDLSAPVMDREQIDRLITVDGGDADVTLARELFELFSTESAAKLESMDEICATGDVKRLRDVVHFVAGSAGNLGLARLAAFYCGVENAIDRGALVDVSSCQAVIRGEFEAACEAFRSVFNL
ncbi:MAG: Hpt domain-containing protein [Opitutales bacterium]